MTVPGQYIFQEQSSGDPPSVQITGPALNRPLSPTGSNDTLLSPGVYSIQFEAATGGPVQDQLFVRLSSDQMEIVLANGVGQGPALSLRLITFSEVAGTPPPVPITPPVLGPFPIAPPAAIALGTTDSLAGFPAGSIRADPQTLRGIPFRGTPAATTSFLGMGSDLVGRPSVPAHGSESSRREAVAGTDPGCFHGVVHGQSLKALPTGPARFLWESASSTGGDLEDAGARPPARATMIELRPAQGNRDRCWFAAVGYPPRGVLSELGRILVRRTTCVRSDQHPRHRADLRARPPPARSRIAARPGGQCG